MEQGINQRHFFLIREKFNRKNAAVADDEKGKASENDSDLVSSDSDEYSDFAKLKTVAKKKRSATRQFR